MQFFIGKFLSKLLFILFVVMCINGCKGSNGSIGKSGAIGDKNLMAASQVFDTFTCGFGSLINSIVISAPQSAAASTYMCNYTVSVMATAPVYTTVKCMASYGEACTPNDPILPSCQAGEQISAIITCWNIDGIGTLAGSCSC